jgi:orotidine-5'-phosphate decarboxylase
MDNPIIVALDVPNARAAGELVQELSGAVGAFKVGLQLFNAVGPEIFEILGAVDPGARLFYDAKFHDIPNTVAGAVREATRNRLWMVNIHASGGRAMMAAAVDAAHSALHQPLVIAVTVLTSLDESDLVDVGVLKTPSAQVADLARLAQEAGCDGVVASGHEAANIKEACGNGFLVVVPGVRPSGSPVGDQKRIMTPVEAVIAGADHIVVGRPITAAPSPREAAIAIVKGIEEGAVLQGV